MRWRASAAETGLQVLAILAGAFACGFGGAALMEALGLELSAEGRLLLGGALGMLGALLALRLLRRED